MNQQQTKAPLFLMPKRLLARDFLSKGISKVLFKGLLKDYLGRHLKIYLGYGILTNYLRD
jgi:hypothetical protein